MSAPAPTPMAAFVLPMSAAAVGGEVVVTGPGNIACSLTPEAAEKSAAALLLAARKSRAAR